MAQAKWQALQMEAIRWRRSNQPARAIECLQHSIEITRQSPELSRETGTSLNYLADLYLQEGLLAQAEVAIRQALQNRLSLHTPEPTLYANDLSILAEVLSKQGRHREALEAGSRALALFQQFYGTDDEFAGQIEELVRRLKQNLAQTKVKNRNSVPISAPILCPRCDRLLQIWTEGMQQQVCLKCGEIITR